MNIYVDFDDCLCETAAAFSDLALEMFGIDVPYEKMRYFNLQMAFDLNDEQYDALLAKGHEPEVLLGFAETPGAVKVLNEWIKEGNDVSIITGRPFSAYEPSRTWLDNHGLKDVKLYSLDKYGRENFMKNSDFSLKLDDYYKMKFDIAVEDSPSAFKFFDHLPDIKVMVFDRPWNRESELPGDKFTRCLNWESIREKVRNL
ncbi:MAG: 2-dehydropantoate 2-reductase [Lachnospiraceae bacterium]|nr:2-dehydropantoate 2-reductase [Lachnospiraceae bacterium]